MKFTCGKTICGSVSDDQPLPCRGAFRYGGKCLKMLSSIDFFKSALCPFEGIKPRKDMNLLMKLEALMKRNGREMSLHLPDGWSSNTYFGFIQPLRYKNKMYMSGVNTRIGFNSEGYYLYIGPPEHDLTKLPDGALLSCGGAGYRIDRAEKVYRNGKVFYIWAVLRAIVEE